MLGKSSWGLQLYGGRRPLRLAGCPGCEPTAPPHYTTWSDSGLHRRFTRSCWCTLAVLVRIGCRTTTGAAFCGTCSQRGHLPCSVFSLSVLSIHSFYCTRRDYSTKVLCTVYCPCHRPPPPLHPPQSGPPALPSACAPLPRWPPHSPRTWGSNNAHVSIPYRWACNLWRLGRELCSRAIYL